MPIYQDRGSSHERSGRPNTTAELPPTMNPSNQPRLANSLLALIAPETWIACGSAIFLACWLFPPGLYERLVGDPNYLFFDWKTGLFTAASIGLFYVGVRLTRRYIPSRASITDATPAKPRVRHKTELVFGALLLIAQVVCLLILTRRGMFSDWLAVLNGEMRYGLLYNGSASRETNPLLGIILVVTPYFLPWIFWLWLSKERRRDLGVILWSLAATYLLIAVPIGKRGYISRPLFGMILVYTLYVAVRGHWSRRDVVKLFAKALIVMLILFAVLQTFRAGPTSSSNLARDLSRYVVGTYNNQAMLQNELLEFPGAGTGYYWTAWLWNFPVARDLLPLSEWRAKFLGPPAPYGAHQRGPLLRSRGVTGTTAISTFGNSYIDFGWFGMLPFLLTGSIAAVAWRGFMRTEMFGVVLYPLIAYSVLDWRGNLAFPGAAFGAIVLLLAVLALGNALETAAERNEARAAGDT